MAGHGKEHLKKGINKKKRKRERRDIRVSHPHLEPKMCLDIFLALLFRVEN